MTRLEILQKLSAGEITVAEAERLLKELRSEAPSPPPPAPETPEGTAGTGEKGGTKTSESRHRTPGEPRWLRIRVGSKESKRDTVRINIPLGLVNASVRLGAKALGDERVAAWDEFLEAVRRGEDGTLVEVDDDGDGVRIYVD